MNRKFVSSSNIHSVGYDAASKTLEIKFHKSGVYQYFDVSINTYNGLMDSYSKGSFFDDHIKENFLYKKISNT